MALERNRFLQLPQPPAPRRKRWGGCWGGLSLFNKQKGGKRIVPATRPPEANTHTNQQNGPRVIGGLPNQPLSILAPPSSPASFSNSAIPSPSCFLSATSPCEPSSTMFVTGPYAHETQLVSPPVFSTFTTEPSTAPLTPPPESAHLTTPSSPDVPYARFLSSYSKPVNDFPRTAPANCYPSQWDIKSDSGRFSGVETNVVSNFFCPETFAQFYDLSSLSNSGGRLSISKDSDGGNAYQSKQSKNCKPDAEELEAYRASFGFSADEIINTSNYVDISDDSFTITLLNSHTSTKLSVGNDVKATEDIASDNKQFEYPGRISLSDDEDIFSRKRRAPRKYPFGSSNSDAEIEYRRARSLRKQLNQS